MAIINRTAAAAEPTANSAAAEPTVLTAAKDAYYAKALKMASANIQIVQCVEVEEWEDSKGKKRYTAHLDLDGEVFSIPHTRSFEAKVGQLFWGELVIADRAVCSKNNPGQAYMQKFCNVTWHAVPVEG